MKQKFLGILLFSLLLYNNLPAQKNAIIWSDPIDKFNPNYPVSIGICDQHLLLSQVSNEAKKERILVKLERQSLSIKETKSLGALRDPFLHNYIFQWNCGSLIISSAHQPEQKKLSILLEQITDAGISQSLDFDFSTYIKPTPSSRIDACTNKAFDKLAVFHFEQASVNAPVSMHLFIGDEKFEVVKKSVYELTPRNYNFDQTAALLDNDGNLHILMAYKESGIVKYKIFAFPVLSDEIVEYSLDLPDKNIIGINFSLNEKEELVSTGIYASEKIQPQRALGLFYFRIDRETGEVASRNVQDFNYRMEPLSIPAGSGVRRSDFQNFSVKRLENLNDGCTIMFAEQSYVEQVCNNDFRTGTIICNDVNISGEMLAVKFNKEGEVLWFEKRSKQQETINEETAFSGFASLVNLGDVILIYNDHKKNKLSGKGTLLSLASGQLHKGLIRFSSIETSDNEAINFTVENKGLLIPASKAEVEPNEIFMISIQKNNFRMMRLNQRKFQ